MTIQEKVREDMIFAMKTGQTIRKDNLKYLMGLFQNKSTNINKTVDDNEAIALIKSMIKKINDAQKLIADTNSNEYQKNLDFLLMCEYLIPKQADEEQIKEYLQTIDYEKMGNAVIGIVIKHFNGQADGSKVKKVLNELKG